MVSLDVVVSSIPLFEQSQALWALEFFVKHAFIPLGMLLEGGWAFAKFVTFLARIIQRLFGFTVHHPGTMFVDSVLHIVGPSPSAIVAIIAFVGPLLLMLPILVLLECSFGTETLPSARGNFTNYGLPFPMNFPQMACEIRLSWLHNTTVVTHIFFGRSPFHWWFCWLLCRLICVRKGRLCGCGGRIRRRFSVRRRNMLSTWLKHRPPVQRSSFVTRSNSLQVRAEGSGGNGGQSPGKWCPQVG